MNTHRLTIACAACASFASPSPAYTIVADEDFQINGSDVDTDHYGAAYLSTAEIIINGPYFELQTTGWYEDPYYGYYNTNGGGYVGGELGTTGWYGPGWTQGNYPWSPNACGQDYVYTHFYVAGSNLGGTTVLWDQSTEGKAVY